MSKSEMYRANAEECQRMADKSAGEEEKRQWLHLARSWLGMIGLRERPRTEGLDPAR